MTPHQPPPFGSHLLCHGHHGIYDATHGRWRCRWCGVPCDYGPRILHAWRAQLPQLPIRWRSVAALAAAVLALLVFAAWTHLGLLAWTLGVAGVSFGAGYLARRWHRPSAGLQYSNDDKTIMESIVACERFLRECVITPAFDAPMLSQPRRIVRWPTWPYDRWQRLLRRMGSTVTTP